MSRFSKAAAEKLGWSFYHESEEVVLRDGANESGISKVVPPSIRAEKFISLPGQDAFRTTEEAPTLGLLLERIHSFEEHLKARLEAPSSEADARPSDEDDDDKTRLSRDEKQLLKQKGEFDRVAAEAADEGLSPGEPGAEDDDLDSLPLPQLRSIAREKGIRPIPRFKKKLVAAIKAAK